jgi:hypothetical protein
MASKEQHLHAILAGFSLTAVALLKRYSFFDKPLEALPAVFWKQLRAASKTKNEAAFPLIFDLYSKPALDEAVPRIAGMLDLPIETVLSETAWVDRYFESRRADFVQVMTQVDFKRVRNLTSEEALDLHGLIDENRYVGKQPFAKSLEHSYICDGNRARIERCKITESHYAANGGAYKLAGELDADEKCRLTAEDDRVREEHQADADEGWIPYDEPYPFSGEMFAGDDLPASINCRCKDKFRYKPKEEAEA